jgi:uroporphyrin-III C-methyltransferase
VPEGRVVLVGAGPGDPDLITRRGLAWLRRAEVLVYDLLVAPELLDEAPSEALRIFAGKAAGRHCASQSAINAILVHHAAAGRLVIRLKGGDPFVFGRGGEEVAACRRAGIPVEVVPGVSSALAAPAAAGIPLTHRGLAASFVVATGHEDAAKDPDAAGGRVNWAALGGAGDTVVVLMGMGALGDIAERLMAGGRDPATPAAVVHRGGTRAQQVVTGTLGDIAARAASLGAPAVIVVGEVARFAETTAFHAAAGAQARAASP